LLYPYLNAVLRNAADRLELLKPEKLYLFLSEKITNAEYRLKILKNTIDAFDPAMPLAKGYAMVSKDGRYISSVSDINLGDELTIRFKDGNVVAAAKEKQ